MVATHAPQKLGDVSITLREECPCGNSIIWEIKAGLNSRAIAHCIRCQEDYSQPKDEAIRMVVGHLLDEYRAIIEAKERDPDFFNLLGCQHSM